LKIALLCDTHFGARSDSQFFLNKFSNFYNNCFFPYLEKNNIKHIIHLGDLVDRQKYVNYVTANVMRKSYIEPCVKGNYDVHIIQGNHDSYFKNTNDISAIEELYGNYDLNIYKYTTEIKINDIPILLIPWIPKDENHREQFFEQLRDTKAQIAIGHLEIAGFEMHKGSVALDGMDTKIFSKFDKVFSGHFHHRSNNDNIYYLGTPYQFTWSDADQVKGFHIFDLETRELTFVPNDDIVFHKVFYDDANTTLEKLLSIDFTSYKDCIVKLIVVNKENPYWFDLFIDNLENAGVEDLLVVEDHKNLDLLNDEEVVSEADDTLSIFNKRILQIVEEKNKQSKLKKIIHELYSEALALE